MKKTLGILVLAFAVLMSIPWLVPHTGVLALVGFVPLLFADYLADKSGMRRFWIWHYLAFVLWNAFTTYWVCNATVGGGIFAVLANALQMSLVFGLFRFSKKKLPGVLPYILLAAMWIAWERQYFAAQISWPWLTLGNAFAGSTRTVQWYEWTGSLGGSLWIWVVNLSVFGLLVSIGEGRTAAWNKFRKAVTAAGAFLLLLGPIVTSAVIYGTREEKSEGRVDVLIAQPNFDPYQKFTSMTQAEQTSVLLDLYAPAMEEREGRVLLLAPETFTSDIILNNVAASPTWNRFQLFLRNHPGADLLFGASTYETFATRSAPH